ncbi:hypothetical protein MRB53_028741 [Persea americana]|uniref:Uncharacterized protein n=1 Tax=Persea americana TaxID=3435 RepID=A0ACC2KGR6_PERAE|nr:hypothetical protein MRB53_028741 [Persea americana]
MERLEVKREHEEGLMNCLDDLKWSKLVVGEGEPVGGLKVGLAVRGNGEVAGLNDGWEEGGNGVVAVIAEGAEEGVAGC